jgi:hypothetical protein
MTSEEYRDRLHEIIAILIFRLQEDEADALLRALERRIEAEGIDKA